MVIYIELQNFMAYNKHIGLYFTGGVLIMDYYKRIGSDLKELLLSIPWVSKINNYSVYVMGVSLVVLLLYAFTISLGGFIYALVYYLFLFSLLLCYVNYLNTYLLIGLWGFAFTRLVSLLFFFNWSNLVALLLFAFLGYIVFRKIGEIKLNS